MGEGKGGAVAEAHHWSVELRGDQIDDIMRTVSIEQYSRSVACVVGCPPRLSTVLYVCTL